MVKDTNLASYAYDNNNNIYDTDDGWGLLLIDGVIALLQKSSEKKFSMILDNNKLERNTNKCGT